MRTHTHYPHAHTPCGRKRHTHTPHPTPHLWGSAGRPGRGGGGRGGRMCTFTTTTQQLSPLRHTLYGGGDANTTMTRAYNTFSQLDGWISPVVCCLQALLLWLPPPPVDNNGYVLSFYRRLSPYHAFVLLFDATRSPRYIPDERLLLLPANHLRRHTPRATRCERTCLPLYERTGATATNSAGGNCRAYLHKHQRADIPSTMYSTYSIYRQ